VLAGFNYGQRGVVSEIGCVRKSRIGIIPLETAAGI
jgi:hypothetical protein